MHYSNYTSHHSAPALQLRRTELPDTSPDARAAATAGPPPAPIGSCAHSMMGPAASRKAEGLVKSSVFFGGARSWAPGVWCICPSMNQRFFWPRWSFVDRSRVVTVHRLCQISTSPKTSPRNPPKPQFHAHRASRVLFALLSPGSVSPNRGTLQNRASMSR